MCLAFTGRSKSKYNKYRGLKHKLHFIELESRLVPADVTVVTDKDVDPTIQDYQLDPNYIGSLRQEKKREGRRKGRRKGDGHLFTCRLSFSF
jgi:hypothetical protein